MDLDRRAGRGSRSPNASQPRPGLPWRGWCARSP